MNNELYMRYKLMVNIFSSCPQSLIVVVCLRNENPIMSADP